MRGLLVKKPYIDLILSGKKKWEVRRRNTRIRGRIALVWNNKVWGTVEIVDVRAFPVDVMAERNEHGVSADEIRRYGKGKATLYAWILENPRPINPPVPVNVPRGAQVWVKLPKEVEKWLR